MESSTTELPTLPSAVIYGTPLDTLPLDLYVPPDGLKVFLKTFEGPLDLLLYLIQHQNIDILDIPIAEITYQYVQYVELIKELHLDLAAEYMVMAAELTEIKSRLLLPTPPDSKTPAPDPRAKLVQQLKEYARYKKAAQDLAALPQVGRDIFPVIVAIPDLPREIRIPEVNLSALLYVMQGVIARASLFSSHQVVQEPLSVRERMSFILNTLEAEQQVNFMKCFTLEEGKAGAVVALLAVLELSKESLIKIKQDSTQILVTRVERVIRAD